MYASTTEDLTWSEVISETPVMVAYGFMSIFAVGPLSLSIVGLSTYNLTSTRKSLLYGVGFFLLYGKGAPTFTAGAPSALILTPPHCISTSVTLR